MCARVVNKVKEKEEKSMKPRTDATGVCQSCVCSTQTPGQPGLPVVAGGGSRADNGAAR